MAYYACGALDHFALTGPRESVDQQGERLLQESRESPCVAMATRSGGVVGRGSALVAAALAVAPRPPAESQPPTSPPGPTPLPPR